MAKTAFRVEDGLVPGHVTNDLGHSTARFRHQYMSGNVDVQGNLQLTGNAEIDGSITVDGAATIPNLSGGGGGGVSAAQSIAYAIALG